MKYYRTCHLFSVRRRRQQICFYGFSFLLLTIYAYVHFNENEFRSVTSVCHCSTSSLIVYETGECFFDTLVCYPGFTGSQCEKRIRNEPYRSHCPSNSHWTKWTSSLIKKTKAECSQSSIALKEWPTSCLFLCFYHQLTGVVQVPSLFWFRALSNELEYWKENPTTVDDRLYEHVEGFHGYKVVPTVLKSIVEVGAGPFTQIQYLLTPLRSVERVTLVEPNALEYMKMNNCAYRGGHLRGHPVQIVIESIEHLMRQRRHQHGNHSNLPEKYAVVMSINVVEHVHDALEYFRGLYDLLADDGLLIFHERWFDHPQDGDCILAAAENLHPIRVTRWIVEQFLSHFEALFINLNPTKRQTLAPCHERGIYFIGRKKSRCL